MPGIFGVIGSSDPRGDLAAMRAMLEAGRKTQAFDTETLTGDNWGLGSFRNRTFSRFKGLFRRDEPELAVACESLIFNRDALPDVISGTTMPETFARLYLQQGLDFIPLLNGNWSLAILDAAAGTLTLAVDRYSAKPLYYLTHGTTIWFASELKALLPVGPCPKPLDADALNDYHLLGFVMSDKTLVKPIKRLPAGHHLVWNIARGEFTRTRWFHPDNAGVEGTSKTAHLENLKQIWERCQRRMLDATIDNGYEIMIPLSGGLDSRTMIHTAQRMGYGPIHSLTWCDLTTEEFIRGRRAIETLGTDATLRLLGNGNWYVNHLDDCVRAGEGMYHYLDVARVTHALHTVDAHRFGLLHMGTTGDGFLGSWVREEEYSHPPMRLDEAGLDTFIARYSFNESLGAMHVARALGVAEPKRRRLLKSARESLWTSDDHEVWNMLNRQQRGVFGFYRGVEERMEYGSHYYDNEFLDYSLKIPYPLKFRQRIYIELVNRHMLTPELLRIPRQSRGRVDIDRYYRLGLIVNRLNLMFRRGLLGRLSPAINNKFQPSSHDYSELTNAPLRRTLLERLTAFDDWDWLGWPKGPTLDLARRWHDAPGEHRHHLLTFLYLASHTRFVEFYKPYLAAPEGAD